MLFLLGASRSGLQAVLLLYDGSTQRAPTHFLTPPLSRPPSGCLQAVGSEPLPPFAEGEVVPITEVELHQGKTSPPDYLTE